MRSFITALQFLTRIHLVHQEGLTAEDFGRSTRFFPLVGAVLGCLSLLAALVCLALFAVSRFFSKLGVNLKKYNHPADYADDLTARAL